MAPPIILPQQPATYASAVGTLIGFGICLGVVILFGIYKGVRWLLHLYQGWKRTDG